MTEEKESKVSPLSSCDMLSNIQADLIKKFKNAPPFGHWVVFSQHCTSDGTKGQLVIDVVLKNSSVGMQTEPTTSESKGGRLR